jgi:Flp pilus assembly protein TadD
LEKRRDQQTRAESQTRLVEQINACLHSGDYSRALDLLRGTAAKFPNDAELSKLEKLAHDGVKRKAEADRLITESQELFAQQRPVEAIRSLREAYELDENNSLARAILSNALVEHAHSMVETDWRAAETLTNQALALNPAHPTAKTILSLIVEQKETSSVEDWVSQAHKLQSSGDLFAALAWVAEGLAVHPHDPKLLLIQDAIQRDQDAQLRQTRRRDLEDLRRMELDIDGAADLAAKQAVAERIQAAAAKYWTDGEMLSVANGLLHRLGLVPQESSTASPRRKCATVIFHVPRPSAPKASRAATSQVPPSPVLPSEVLPKPIPPRDVPTGIVPPSRVSPRIVPRGRVRTTPSEPQLPPEATAVPAERSASVAKVTSPSSQPKQPMRSNATTRILVSSSAAAIILIAATFFFTPRHYAPPIAKTPSAAPAVSAPVVSAPAVAATTVSASPQTTSEPSLAALPLSSDSSDTTAGKVALDDQPPAASGHNLGSLLVVAGQDGASVFLNGKLQRQLTQAGQLRLPNLELKDYFVSVSKSGFQDPPPQEIRIRKGEQARLVFNLQPQPRPQPLPRLASLTIEGGVPGTTVFVDQTPVGTIQPDGTLSVSTVNPGDHTVELRKERFQPRHFKKHFMEGGTISLAAADAALEAAPGVLTINFTPPDAKVAIVKGDVLKMVSSGVPLNLAAGTYTLTARTADGFTSSSSLEVIAGQSETLDLSLAPNGMSNWDDPSAWKQERDSFIHKGGDFVLYGVAPASGTFVFSAMLTKGHLLQWVLNYTDPRNYILVQMDDYNFYRTVIRNGEKTNEIIVPHKSDKKTFRTLHIRVCPTELVHQIKNGDSWTVLDRWTQPGSNLSLGKFGFYIPGDDQVALTGFAHYADLNIR